MVRDSSVQPSGNVTTTYDKLIQNYADLHARLIDATIVQGQAQEILDIYADVTQDTDPRSAEAQWASARIDELVQKFTSLYDLALMTIDEFNQVNGADNIEMKNSIVVTEKLNLKLYAALSVVLFLFVGCFCAIFLGRLGDFVDYYLYVDKKSGLPNRERCDAAIDHYSTTRLKGQFTIICIQLDFSAMSRNDGDKALRLLGDQLQYVFRTLGFVGYNGAGRFIVLLENCSFDLAKTASTGWAVCWPRPSSPGSAPASLWASPTRPRITPMRSALCCGCPSAAVQTQKPVRMPKTRRMRLSRRLCPKAESEL